MATANSMGKYFITGNAGTGKSSIIYSLKLRGYAAYDIDDTPSIHGYLDRQNGTITDLLPATELRGAEAFRRYASVFQAAGMKTLLGSSETIFIGGSVTNQTDFYPLFDQVFGLIADNASLEQRLAHRTNNPTGNERADRAYLISISARSRRNLEQAGAWLIDSCQPLETVVTQIINKCLLADNSHP